MNSTIDTSCYFLNQNLRSCIWNASGALCSTEEELMMLAQSESSLVLSKSCTLHPRTGNPSPRYRDIPLSPPYLGSINSMGLPNLGVDLYIEIARRLPPTKPYMISIAGLSFEENRDLLSSITSHHLPSQQLLGIELNLSCPNVMGKPQVGYDCESTERTLEMVFSFAKTPSIGVKLPPYFDFVHFDQMAKVLSKFPLAFITAINSIGNAIFIDIEQECVVTKPRHGYGGLGGAYIKPTALANVRKWKEYFPLLPIVGCGGVQTGNDIFEHILCGASAVQVGTQLMQEGTTIFQRLNHELVLLMKQKGYQSLADFRGKLKTL